MANAPGLRSLAFEVDDVQAIIERLAANGIGLVGGIGEYERVWPATRNGAFRSARP